MTEPTSVQPSPPPAPVTEQPVASMIPPAILPLMRLLPPPPVGTILAPPEPMEPARRGWFVAQIWAEVRLAMRMYFDPRYRISRTAQVAFPLVGVLLALNYFLFSVWFSVAFVSPIAERLLDALVVLLGYRILIRELDRYRAVLDYLSRFNTR
ncbi:hypothetical protein VT84_31250 [Gemmata sp. SH-PL17]|uniref:hypothetical protein n=1 Tax=Gemmata sp. SH-PL17 TaxID=1630693 RepID=UPI0004B42CFA|nr:hypothetical protein [Gemmata sp. SH-PL17]AMV28912.1 hypothetical protein VT84_31250 [Gemmata sp. SH-PL17]